MQRLVFFSLITIIFFPKIISAQLEERRVQDQCATMQRLQQRLERNPELKRKFEQERVQFKKAVRRGAYRSAIDDAANRTYFSIPVVFHVVSTSPETVSEARIQAQMDTLNKDFAGMNGDSVKIPSYFKPLFGKSNIQFCLAQRTPTGEPTTGIERVRTTKTSFSTNNEDVKHTSTGGADSWDNTKYYNVWLCVLSNGILGYSTFPNDASIPPNEQGVVIDYRSLPGGSLANYNTGKTLTHETGHYFNLFHIWGDDNGACTGSDDVDDTPNQSDATKACYTGIKTDTCTPNGNGIMYENYMDYSYDNCLVMFTVDQVARMESALLAYRSSLLKSNGCVVPIVKNFDARLWSVDQPEHRLCSSSFAPSVTIKNTGSQTLTSLTISTKIDNGAVSNFKWNGSLGYLAAESVSLNNLTTSPGTHTLTIYVSNPNNKVDEDVTNDTIASTIQFYNPVTTISESFEKSSFPNNGWDVVNPDDGVTWKRVTGIAKTGSASMMVDNYNYNSVGETDDLRLPDIALQSVDSAFLSFQVAAAAYSDVSSNSTNAWDTLQVLASTDCGLTYTTLYKKYGSTLVTTTTPTTNAFTPAPTEWRKDSINLTDYVGQPNLLLAFRNTTGYENDVYLDDVNLRTVVVNPNLKSRGFLVTPNPTSGVISVQFYPQPNNLRAIQVFNMTGQKLSEILVGSGQANNNYLVDIGRYAAGTYMVRAVFTDRVITRKILKY
jgi:hypothetical protein